MTRDASASSLPGATLLGHTPESVMFNGEEWWIVCSCAWECWEARDEYEAWDLFDDHVLDDVRTELRRIHDNAKVVTL